MACLQIIILFLKVNTSEITNVLPFLIEVVVSNKLKAKQLQAHFLSCIKIKVLNICLIQSQEELHQITRCWVHLQRKKGWSSPLMCLMDRKESLISHI